MENVVNAFGWAALGSYQVNKKLNHPKQNLFPFRNFIKFSLEILRDVIWRYSYFGLQHIWCLRCERVNWLKFNPIDPIDLSIFLLHVLAFALLVCVILIADWATQMPLKWILVLIMVLRINNCTIYNLHCGWTTNFYIKIGFFEQSNRSQPKDFKTCTSLVAYPFTVSSKNSLWLRTFLKKKVVQSHRESSLKKCSSGS